MTYKITDEDRKEICKGINRKYEKVANSPKGLFRYPTGREGLEKLNYNKDIIDILPDSVANSYCGVGNPFSLGEIKKGDKILDIGCGAGVDTIISAIMSGPTGSSTGVDIVEDMLKKAETNLYDMNMNNVSFLRINGRDLPFTEGEFSVAISNGVINLIPDKERILDEIFRVLKPGGRLMIADQISITEKRPFSVANWFQ